MKKIYLAAAVMALALGMTACSSKTEETAAQTEAAAQASSAEADTEDLEVEYFDGSVNVVEESVVTVADAEGTEHKFGASGCRHRRRGRRGGGFLCGGKPVRGHHSGSGD